MSFGTESIRGGRNGAVDYRLARRALVAEYRKGRLARHQVCDAHPELVRAARSLGEPTRVPCPICEESNLVLVTYVFGSRLPAHGRCISQRSELTQLSRRSDQLIAYVVECCPECSWHHLARTFVLGGVKKRRVAATEG